MKYETSKNEKYAEQWFDKNGFEFKLIKQHISKTKYEVSKDGIVETFELPSAVTDCKKYMELFDKSFEMKKQIVQMR